MIIPSFRLPSRVSRGAFVLQVNCAYRTDEQVTSFGVCFFTSFGMFQCQRWFHSNQDGVYPRYEHNSMCYAVPAMHPLNEWRTVSLIADLALAISRTISVSLNRDSTSRSCRTTPSSQPCGSHMQTSFRQATVVGGNGLPEFFNSRS